MGSASSSRAGLGDASLDLAFAAAMCQLGASELSGGRLGRSELSDVPLGMAGVSELSACASELDERQMPDGCAQSPRLRISQVELQRICELEFVEKAVFSTRLPTAPVVEAARWTVGLLVGAPLWSYSVAGDSSHWFFVSRTPGNEFYYVAQFGVENGKNVVSEMICVGWHRVMKVGRQSPGEPVRLVKDWKANSEVRLTWEMHNVISMSECIAKPYSFVFNNCQHFAETLYNSDCASSI